jgi:hypothetical protein
MSVSDLRTVKYRVFVLQAYQMSGELLRISYRETVRESPANWRSFIRWSRDQCNLALPSVTVAFCYCALFFVFMARVRYNLEQIVFIYDCYVKANSYDSCRRKFQDTLSAQHVCEDKPTVGVRLMYTRPNYASGQDDVLPRTVESLCVRSKNRHEEQRDERLASWS